MYEGRENYDVNERHWVREAPDTGAPCSGRLRFIAAVVGRSSSTAASGPGKEDKRHVWALDQVERAIMCKLLMIVKQNR